VILTLTLNESIEGSKEESSIERTSLICIRHLTIRLEKLFIGSGPLLDLERYANSRSLTCPKATLSIALSTSYRGCRRDLK
jgi:hypothetical protein